MAWWTISNCKLFSFLSSNIDFLKIICQFCYQYLRFSSESFRPRSWQQCLLKTLPSCQYLDFAYPGCWVMKMSSCDGSRHTLHIEICLLRFYSDLSLGFSVSLRHCDPMRESEYCLKIVSSVPSLRLLFNIVSIKL